MSRLRSWRDDETGRIGPPLLLALVGGLVGGPLDVLVAALLFDVMCGVRPAGSLGNAEGCGLEGLLLLLSGLERHLFMGRSEQCRGAEPRICGRIRSPTRRPATVR